MEYQLDDYNLVSDSFDEYIEEVEAQDRVKETVNRIFKGIDLPAGSPSIDYPQLSEDIVQKVERYANWERNYCGIRLPYKRGYDDIRGLMALEPVTPPEPSKSENEAYQLHQIKKKSTPGKVFLGKIEMDLAFVFESIKSFEFMVLNEQNRVLQRAHLCNLIVIHCVNIEALLANIFSGSIDIANHLLNALEPKQAKILLHSLENKKQVYGSLGCLAISLRRNLQDNQPEVLSWIQANFNTSLTRFYSEKCDLIEMLRGKGLPQFIGRIRNNYRNTRVHPVDFDFDMERYSLFSDTCYATPTLSQWLEIGVNPAIFKFQEFGWVSALAASAATR